MNIDRGIMVRSVLAIFLAALALAFFLSQGENRSPVIEQPASNSNPAAGHADWRVDLPLIDHQVDSILTAFGIQKTRMKRKQYPVPDANFSRIERKVDVPPDFLPVELNAALNAMAHAYNGRAIASENLREHITTIHIELNGYIIETLALSPKLSLKSA